MESLLPVEIIAIIFAFIIGAVGGAAIAFFSRRIVFNRQLRLAERKAARMVAEARNESKGILQEAQDEIKNNRATADSEYRERRSELQKQENRLNQKQETLERKIEGVEQRDRNLTNKEKEIETIRNQMESSKKSSCSSWN